MGNVLRVFRRDVKRLFHMPAALLVAFFLVVLPSLYTWFNVVGFWNPYDNTGNLRVCIVNEDAGTDDQTLGHLDVGASVVSQLEGDSRLQWAFVSRDQALDEIAAGHAYAAFVIPEDFSADVASITSGDFQQPSIEYYVNEKVGPVSPKIMDTGANSLDTSINSAFVATVSSAVATALDESAAEIRGKVERAGSEAIAHLDTANAAIENVRSSIASLAETAQSTRSKTEQAQDALKDARDRTAQIADAVTAASTLLGDANAGIVKASTALATALDDGSIAATRATTQTAAVLGNISSSLSSAQGDIDAATERGKALAAENEATLDRLKEIASVLPSGTHKDSVEQAIETLDAANDKVNEELDTLQVLSHDASEAATAATTSANEVNSNTKQALAAIGDYRATLSADAMPAIGDGLAALAASGNALSSSVSGQGALIDQTSAALGQLQSTLSLSADALSQTDGVLVGLQQELSSVKTDMQALISAESLDKMTGELSVDPVKVAEFMQSPTQVKTEELYPMNAYGSAMAPLFINLTLWIGVFMLMVIIRLEVDDEGIERLTVPQRYFGRGLLLGIMAVLQAIVCCAGCMVIGVQAENVAALYLTAVVASLSYLSIQYTLSSMFLHVGKAFCVILVFVQIPAATGLYPIEMTPSFFQTVYPLFPFTYGINAMREAVFGFYGNLWMNDLLVLLGFMAAFTALGALGRPYTANLNRLFARQIRETDIINIEHIELPERHYRITQLLDTLLDREEYRADVERRVMRFMQMYPTLRKGALVVGIGIPAVLTVAFAATDTDKVAMLTAWLLGVIGIIGFLIGVEYVRDRLLHQLQLNDLSAEEVRDLYTRRSGSSDVPPADAVPDPPAGAETAGGA